MPVAALDISELTVHYGKRTAVDKLSLQVNAGEVVGMLGPNGAGKSTTLLAVAGALMPSAGTIAVAGTPMTVHALDARARMGFADQPPSLYEFFTVSEHLAFVAEARGRTSQSDIPALLGSLGLLPIADRYCRELSFGMRQRVGLAAALVGGVDVLLLDETLNGLDPRAAKQARDVVAEAAAGGCAVLMSTHLLGVAERLCTRVIIMDAGKIVADVGGDELTTLLQGGDGSLEELYLARVIHDEA